MRAICREALGIVSKRHLNFLVARNYLTEISSLLPSFFSSFVDVVGGRNNLCFGAIPPNYPYASMEGRAVVDAQGGYCSCLRAGGAETTASSCRSNRRRASERVKVGRAQMGASARAGALAGVVLNGGVGGAAYKRS